MPLKMGAHQTHQGLENMRCVCLDLIVELLADLCVQDNFTTYQLPNTVQMNIKFVAGHYLQMEKVKYFIFISAFYQRRV